MLEAKNIEKSFGKLKVLNKINLTVEKGERVVIIGPSGSGKSTFLRCLNLLEKSNKGEVIYNGKVITDNNKLEMRKKIGMVFQSFNLFKNLTVLENLTLAPVKEKILTVPGNAFGECGEGFIRACYASSMENIYEALRRIERFVKEEL